MGMMDKMMGVMMGRMGKEDKEGMMGKMMEKFFAGMTAEDKQKMMADMMPQMMMGMMGGGEGKEGMMGMMDKMMGGGEGKEGMMGMMDKMMGGGQGEEMAMMPQCLKMMLPQMPKEKRIDFALEMVTTLMEQGCTDMSNEEKEDFVAKIIEKVRA